ncbi:UNVERIFIED_ORG: acyl-CoA dehydrogenase [Gordonia westfalica J30]
MTIIPGVDPDLSDMMRAVLVKHAANNDGPVTLDLALWSELTKLGLTRLTGPGDAGGSEASWYEAAELLSAAAAVGVRAPLAEHDLLACALRESAGLTADRKLSTVAVLDADGVGRFVPWASAAERVVALWRSDGGWLLSDLATEDVIVSAGVNLIGEPRDEVRVDPSSLSGTPVAPSLIERYRLQGALARALQTCAALDRSMTLTIEYVTARTQFGRPLTRFQAVQNLVADIAAECALARAATEAALDSAVRADWSGDDLRLRVAVARSCTGHAASVVVRNAHQAHGAIGTTREHPLHRYTRAAIVWRGEFGSVAYWDEVLADAARTAGADGLWPLVTK